MKSINPMSRSGWSAFPGGLVVVLVLVSSQAYARPPASDISNPIAGALALFFIVWSAWIVLKSFVEKPIDSFRVAFGLLVAVAIGFGVPIYLSMKFDPGGWFGLIWISSWLGGGGIAYFIFPDDNKYYDPKEDKDR